MVFFRKDNPALWAEFTAHIRDVVGDWTDDQIAAVASKVLARSPGALMDSIAEVFVYCGAALKSGDEEAVATVELWQMPELPIEIEIIDGKIYHRLAPETQIEIIEEAGHE